MTSLGILMMEFNFLGKRKEINIDYLRLQVWILLESNYKDPEESYVIVGKILEHLISFFIFTITVYFCVYKTF